MDKYYMIEVSEYDEVCDVTYIGMHMEDDIVLIFRTAQDAKEKMKEIVEKGESRTGEGKFVNVQWGDDHVEYDIDQFGITSGYMTIVEARLV